MSNKAPTNEDKIDIKEIMESYRPNEDILTGDSEYLQAIKSIIYNDLDEIDRRIILLYAELGTQRKVAKALNISLFVTNRRIRQIQQKIKERL